MPDTRSERTGARGGGGGAWVALALLACAAYALLPLQPVRGWILFAVALAGIAALLLGGCLLGLRFRGRFQNAGDASLLRKQTAWLKPACAVLACVASAIVADMTIAWARAAPVEVVVPVQRVSCLHSSNRPVSSVRQVAERDGRWCFAAERAVGRIDVPIEQVRGDLALGAHARAQRFEYRSPLLGEGVYYRIGRVF
ncbi:hypothetical protein LDO32_16790 [Luteimonas sp. Y-2-2-4F]|nr:hypothetical protein [Luteimonas sp. Y-2-2-4F]MCD9033374.1 hypothetical protein [Luteimonas sp. Y-2-2-4F]